MIDRYSRPAMKMVWSETNKYDKWLQVEIAVCEAWADAGTIPMDSLERIRLASYDIGRIDQAFQETRHDMTAFLRSVSETVGPDSRFIHLGLTSYDIQDNALSLQLLDAIDILREDVHALTKVLTKRALEHKNTLMMGRTHGVHAEPTTFGMKLLVWVEEMKRNALRLEQAREVISVGKVSGAVGSHSTIPPSIEDVACEKLGLAVAPASTQTIQRDRHAQFVQTLALIAASLEKFATEVRALQKTEVRELEEPFAEGQTGSSAMPHKRNPELSERVCGLARLIRGHSITALENVALWHERDISHSSAERLILPDSCLALDYILDIFTFVIRELQVFPERMTQNMDQSKGLVFSQRLLLSLIDKGLDRQQAYKLVQQNAMTAWDSGASFRELVGNDTNITSHLSTPEIDALFDYGFFVKNVDEVFSRVGL
ncbi:adenylosuccinate lyase [Dehalococcoidia bacterium]|nr:adenylosuccinate lyase [Dehalococcoidia bacterium]